MNQIKKMIKTILSDVEEFDVYQEVIEYSNDGKVISKIEYSDEGELMSDQKNEYQDGKLVSTRISHPLIFSEEDISYKRDENGLLLEIIFKVNEEVDMIKKREYSEDKSLLKELWVDANENILRTIEFDSKGRVCSEIAPEGYETKYNYNEFDNLAGVKIYEGEDLIVEQKNEFNERGNQIKSHGVNLNSNQEVVVEKRYDDDNLLVEELEYVGGYHEITKQFDYNNHGEVIDGREFEISPSDEKHLNLHYTIEYSYHNE